MSKYWTQYIHEGNVAGAKAYQERYGKYFSMGEDSFVMVADANCDQLKLVDDLIAEDHRFSYPDALRTIAGDIENVRIGHVYHKYRVLNGIHILLYLLSRDDKEEVMIMEDMWNNEWSDESYLTQIYEFMRANRADIVQILAELSRRVKLLKSKPIAEFLGKAFGAKEVPKLITDALQVPAFNRRKHLLRSTFKNNARTGGKRQRRLTRRRGNNLKN